MKKEEKLKINLELLRELIEKSGITYRELSKSLESSASKLNKWVTNQQKTSISMNDLLKLCIILDTPLEYLVDSNTR
jgi:transcriptional regulator with XRE-family HTH domain